MPDFAALARDLVALHDTDADLTLVDNVIEMATRLDEEGAEASTKLVEDFFALANWLTDYMDADLVDAINTAEISAMATL